MCWLRRTTSKREYRSLALSQTPFDCGSSQGSRAVLQQQKQAATHISGAYHPKVVHTRQLEESTQSKMSMYKEAQQSIPKKHTQPSLHEREIAGFIHIIK